MPPWAPSTVRAQACETLGDPSARTPWTNPAESRIGLAAVGSEQHTLRVDGGDGADGAVDEWGVAVTVAGVEQHPVACLVLAFGCPSWPVMVVPVRRRRW